MNFFYETYIIFSLCMVLCALLRVIKVWYHAGGRIRIRRDPSTRRWSFIQHPPRSSMSLAMFLFSANSLSDHEDDGRNRKTGITVEKALANLPEVVFIGFAEETGITLESSIDKVKDADTVVSSSASLSVNTAELSAESEKVDVERGTEGGCSTQDIEEGDLRRIRTSSSSSCDAMCIVCLEEYEFGEKVRQLPCGHLFHADCIVPWLTERQNCCPFCKTSGIKEV